MLKKLIQIDYSLEKKLNCLTFNVSKKNKIKRPVKAYKKII